MKNFYFCGTDHVYVCGMSTKRSTLTCDHQTKPGNQTGEDVLNMVKDVKVVFGKAHGSELVPNDADSHASMWKKKSIFWELPCWQS